MTYFEQFLFVNPFAFSVPMNKYASFVLIIAVSLISGLVLPIEIIKIIRKDFYFKNMKEFFAAFLGVSASCGCVAGIGLGLVTVFGVAGSSLLGFLHQYQDTIRLISVIILLYSFYFETKAYGQKYCKIK